MAYNGDYGEDEVYYGEDTRHQQIQSMNAQQRQEFCSTIIQSAVRGMLLRNSLRDRMKQHRHRTRVVREIRETEKTYRNSLSILMDTVVQPLIWNADHSAIPIVNKEDVTAMFSNVEQILKLSDELFVQFEDRVKNWYCNQQIADIFNRFGPFLRIYTVYCNNYDKANEALSRVAGTENFLQFWESVSLIHSNLMSLSSYLIMPVQRIPRYELLLKDLSKSTWPDHPDSVNIQTALKLIQDIGVHVNRAIGNADVTQDMVEAQQNFGAFISPPPPSSSSAAGTRDSSSYGLLSPTRRFLRKGVLKWQKQSTKYDVICLWLFNDMIILSDQVSSSATGTSDEHYTYKSHTYLFNDEGDQVAFFEDVTDLGQLKNIFRIYGQEASYTFRTREVRDKVDWTRAINDTISALIALNDQKRAQLGSGTSSSVQAFTANTTPRRLPGFPGSPSGSVATVLASIKQQQGGATANMNNSNVMTRPALQSHNTIPRTTAQIVGTADREDSKGKKYTAYIVELNIHSSGQMRRIYKRYSEFDALDKGLRAFLLEQAAALPPGPDGKPPKASRQLPFMPPKKLYTTSKDLEKRVLALGSYLQSVLIMTDIRTHPAVSVFMEDIDGIITGVRSTSVSSDGVVSSSSSPSVSGSITSLPSGAVSGGSMIKIPTGGMMMVGVVPGTGGDARSGPNRQDSGGVDNNMQADSSTSDQFVDVTITMCSGEELKLTLGSNDKCRTVLQSAITRSGLSLQDNTAAGFALYVITPDELLGLDRMDLHFWRALEDDEFPLRVLQARQAKSPSAMMILQRAVWCMSADKIIAASNGRLSELLMHQISRDVINGSCALSVEDTARISALYAQATVRGGFSRDSAANYTQDLEFLPRVYRDAMIKDDANPYTASAQGGVDLRMYGMTAGYDTGDGVTRPRLIRLWSRGFGRPAITIEAWHDRDYDKWVKSLAKKVALVGSESDEKCVQQLVRLSSAQNQSSQSDSSVATTTESPMQRLFTNNMFQGAAKQYVTGLMLSECEGWLTKQGRGRSALIGKANWKNRWFVLIGTKLIYFKSVPQMAFKRAMWQELFVRHWNHCAKLQPYQASFEYLKVAQSYPYYGAAYYPVTFDPTTAPPGFERAFPAVVTLGITHRNVLVMDPISRAVYAEFEEEHIEAVQAFPGDLKVKLFQVDNLVVFHTSLAYDILRLYTAASVFDTILAAAKEESKEAGLTGDSVEVSRNEAENGNKIVGARNNRASKRFTPATMSSSQSFKKIPNRVLSNDGLPNTNPTLSRGQSAIQPATYGVDNDEDGDDDDEDYAEGDGILSSIRMTMGGTRVRDALGGGFHPLLAMSRTSKMNLAAATNAPTASVSPVTSTPVPSLAQQSSFMKSFSRLGNIGSSSASKVNLSSIDEKVQDVGGGVDFDDAHVKSTFRHDMTTADRSVLKQAASKTVASPGIAVGPPRGFQLPVPKKRVSVDDSAIPNATPPPPVPAKHGPPIIQTSPLISHHSGKKSPAFLQRSASSTQDKSNEDTSLQSSATKPPPPTITRRPSKNPPSITSAVSSSVPPPVPSAHVPSIPSGRPPAIVPRAKTNRRPSEDLDTVADDDNDNQQLPVSSPP